MYADVCDNKHKLQIQESYLADLQQRDKRRIQSDKNQEAVANQMMQTLVEFLREGKCQHIGRTALQRVQALAENRPSSENIASSELKAETAESSSAPTPCFLETEVLLYAQHLEDHMVGEKDTQ